MTGPAENQRSKGGLILTVVALVAVGGLISYVFLPMGIVILASVVVALIWTIILSFRSPEAGGPVGIHAKAQVFFVTLGSAFVVLIAASIAFLATCFPIGLFGMQGEGGNPGDDRVITIAYIVGGVAAALAGSAAAYFLYRSRRAASTEKPPKKRRW
jgi:hypothetical protein